MMIDLSNSKLSIENFDSFYNEIEKKSNKEINTIWLGVQDYQPVFDLQKKIHDSRINKKMPPN